MQGLQLRITHPDGRTEQMLVESNHVLVGSAAHCEVRLAIDQAALEHVAIQTGPAGIFAQARTLDPAPRINGVAFTQGRLLPDSVLEVGQTRIAAAIVDIAEDARIEKAKKQRVSPFTMTLAAITIPLAAYVLLTDEGDEPARAAPKAPDLFAAAETACPQRAPEAAQALARDLRLVADGKRERRPFHVQDGVAAVPIYQRAAACAAAGGDAAGAREAGETADALKQSVEEDYRTHRVRLEHAMSVGDWQTTQREVRVLLAFLDGRQGEYVVWLSNLDRKLALKYGRRGP